MTAVNAEIIFEMDCIETDMREAGKVDFHRMVEMAVARYEAEEEMRQLEREEEAVLIAEELEWQEYLAAEAARRAHVEMPH